MRISLFVASLSVVVGSVVAGSGIASPALAAESAAVMQQGTTGSTVLSLQKELKTLGFYPKRQGTSKYFGPLTAKAVIAFKQHHKLGRSDRVSPRTMTLIHHLAAKVSTPTKVDLAQQILAKARTYLGDPYVWGGESPAGFDCSGFVKYVFAQFNIDLPRTTQEQGAQGTYIGSRSDLQPGDIVFFDTSGGVSHDGIYIGNDLFINAASKDVEIDSLNNVYWNPRYLFGRRVL